MSDLNFMGGFNADEHDDLRDDSPLPEGEYYLEAEDIKVKETANGQGKGANVTFNVLGEKETQALGGRKVFAWFNLQHSNEVAQRIGQAEFASFCKAVAVTTPQDTDELLSRPFLAKVGFDKREPTKNIIKKYSLIDESAAEEKPAAQASTPPPQATATPASTSAPAKKLPWQK